MKIAFLSFYSGNVYRGVETFVHEVANKLVNFGNEVAVFQGGAKLDGSKYQTVTIDIDCDWQNKGSYFPYLNYYALRVKEFTRRSLKKINKDTDILIPTNGQWQSLLTKLWVKQNTKRMIIVGQSGPGIDDRLNLLSFPDAFIGLTDYQVAWAIRANPFVKVVKIPNGVDTKKFTVSGERLVLDLPRPIILCVAAFDSWKRNDLIIKAVSRFKKGSLLLVGKGNEENKLRSLGEKLLPGRFEILNFTHAKMPTVYRAADIFTFATVPWESFGIVLVEAMASGLPVVACDDPIRREIVGEAGLFVDPNNTSEYANALQTALDKKWGDIPRQQAEKFGWEEIAKKYDQLFRNLTGI